MRCCHHRRCLKKGVIRMTRKFGYARVSSTDLNLDSQYEALLPYVGDKDKIFSEKASGKDFEGREVLKGLCKTLTAGDSLYIVSLDRLGWRKKDIKMILEDFRKNGVSIKVLDLPTTMVEATDYVSAVAMDMITNLLIEVLGYMAEIERCNFLKRRAEGLAAAKAKGKHLGRNPKPLPDTWEEDMNMWMSGKCSVTTLLKKYPFCRSTFYNKVKEWKKRSIT